MHAMLAVTPVLLLLILLWTAWRVLAVLRGIMVPARIRQMRPSGESMAVQLVLDTREADGTTGEARIDLPHARGLAPGDRVTLWRGARPVLAWCSHRTLTIVTLVGGAGLWLALYLPWL